MWQSVGVWSDRGIMRPCHLFVFLRLYPHAKELAEKGEDKNVTDHEEKEEEEMDSWSGSHEHL